MAMYSQEDIDEVMSRNDIVDVVSSYISIKRSGSNYFGLCPFHSEKTPSFSVSEPKQIFYCFGCHKGGNVLTFLMEYNNMNFPEAVEELANRCGYNLPKQQMSEAMISRQTKRTKLSYIYKDAANYYYARLHSSDGEKGMHYFRDIRGLDRDIMSKFALGYAGGSKDALYRFLKDKDYSDEEITRSGLVKFDEKRGIRDYFINRVIFPIVNERGDPIALGGRVLDDSKPKYLNTRENEIFAKRRTIYGLNIARRTREDMYILCEGYMDVIALHQAGFDNAVAALGTAFTLDHAARLKRANKKIYICFDSDSAGIDAALRAIGILKLSEVDCKVITMGQYKDPDEYIKAEGRDSFKKRVDNAENAFIWAIDMKRRQYNINDPEENNQFFRNMAGRIAILKTDIERDNYITVLAKRYNVTTDSLKELIRDVSVNERELNSIKDEFYKGFTENDIKANDNDEDVLDDKSHYNSKSTKSKGDRGLKETEGIMLTWLFEEPALYSKISDYISPLDFSDGLYRDIARDMIDAYESGHNFDAASIMCRFEDNKAHEAIANMLHTKIEGITSDKDKELLLKETLIKLKQENLKSQDRSSPDAGRRIREINADIRKLQTTHIL